MHIVDGRPKLSSRILLTKQLCQLRISLFYMGIGWHASSAYLLLLTSLIVVDGGVNRTVLLSGSVLLAVHQVWSISANALTVGVCNSLNVYLRK